MRYAGLIKNDIAAGPGICVTFFTQGCPHRCHGCHNPETWDFNVGDEFDDKLKEQISDKIMSFNAIIENIMIFGGEPLD